MKRILLPVRLTHLPACIVSLFFPFLFLLSMGLNAQEKPVNGAGMKKPGTTAPPIRFYDNGKVGYKDSNGKVLIPAIYQAGTDFSDGLALVVDRGLRGFVNAKGDVVIPFSYTDASVFRE